MLRVDSQTWKRCGVHGLIKGKARPPAFCAGNGAWERGETFFGLPLAHLHAPFFYLKWSSVLILYAASRIKLLQVAVLLDCTTWTGVGPGMMDAVVKGALQAGKPVGGFKISKEAGEWTSSNFHPYLQNHVYYTCRQSFLRLTLLSACVFIFHVCWLPVVSAWMCLCVHVHACVHAQVHGSKENVCIQNILVGIHVYMYQVCSIVNVYMFVCIQVCLIVGLQARTYVCMV